MRAMVLPRSGGSNLFEMHELERPEPGCGEVLVCVVASAVNPVDAKLRADGGWAKLDPPVILGYDVAGIVEEVGHSISDFKNRRRGLLHSGNHWQPTWELRRLQCRIRCDRRAQTDRFVICRSQCDSACRGDGLGGGSPQVSGSARRNHSDSWRRGRGRFLCSSICQSRRGESSGQRER